VEILGPSKKDMSAAGTNVKTLSKLKSYLPGFLFEIAQILFNLVSYRKIRKYIKEYQPDFIYERYALYSFAGILAANKLAVPLILEVNTPYAHVWEKYYRLYFPTLAKKVEKFILNKANWVITVTESQRRFLAVEYLELDKISVTQNAININEFNPDVRPADIEWKVSDPVVIGFVGTMNRWQGIPVLSEVIPRVIDAVPNAVFLLVGDGEYRAALENQVNISALDNNVRFTGRVAHKEVPHYVSNMDITILPDSNTHGSPMKIFEYMAAKKAIIAPDVEPVNEIVTHEKTGLIISRSNADQLTKAIIILAQDKQLRISLAKNAYAYVISNHTWIENARKVLSAYDRVNRE